MRLYHQCCLPAFLTLVLSACAATPSERDGFALALPSARSETWETPRPEDVQKPTQIIVLGTGTPVPDAFRAGSSIAVIHKGESYVFDVGAGSVRHAVVARYKYDVPSLYPSQVCCVFLSHLHSDHTMDLGELAHTYWWRRRDGLKIWGPEGVKRIAAGLQETIAIDVEFRTSSLQPVQNPNGYITHPENISPGILFEKDGLTVEAFVVNHGEIDPAYGFKVTTEDLSLVISGDTAYSETVVEKARGVDFLFHEVISRVGLERNSPGFQRYHNSAHTTSDELARLANITQPKKLVLYHGLFYGTEESTVLDEIRALYDGEVILASDLDVFTN